MGDELIILAESTRKHLYQWNECNIETEKMLNNLATLLDEKFKKISIAKTAGATTSIVGGILSAVGFGLSFVTFGASLGLSIAGRYLTVAVVRLFAQKLFHIFNIN